MKKIEPPRQSSYTPSSSPDPARHSSYTHSSSRDPARHSSYTPSSSRDPARHSSYTPSSSPFKIPKPRKSLYVNQQTAADLGFPLMVEPMKVPIIERFKDIIPDWSHKFVSDIVDVRPDGNCGFRAIAVALGKHQKEWADVRRKILNELDSHKDWWKHTFDKEQEGVYDYVRSGADWFDSVLPAPRSRWFGVPGHALVVAQTYGCVVVHLRERSSESYFPLIQGPNNQTDIPVIGIVFIGDNHWIYVKLEGNFPMPVPTRYWQRYATPEAAKEWTEFYEHRISEYRKLMEAWRRPAEYYNVG